MANKDLVNSLLRGMDMVKLIGRSPRGLRLNEVAAAMDLKVPTAYNLLRTLQAGGFLDKRNNLFFVGRELIALARGCDPGGVGALAENILFSLYRQVPENILIFGVAQDDGIAQTLRMSFDRPGVIQHLDHELFHPYTSAAGLLGLAFADEAGATLLEERRPFAEFGADYWKDRGELDRFLEQVRRDGFAVSPFGRDHVQRISAGVFDAGGKLIGVVGISAPGRRSDGEMERLRERVVAAAREMSRQLGGE